MLNLTVGNEYAMRVFGMGSVEDRWMHGVLTELPKTDGLVAMAFADGERAVMAKALHRVVTTAKKAVVSDLLVRHNEKPLLIDTEAMRSWAFNEELFQEQERDASRREEQAAARAQRRQAAEAAEARNRAKREGRAKRERDDKRLAELGFVIDETKGLRFVGVK